ncbi:5'-nucleotidase C-terminal domain-containing protein [Niallia sp. MER TA 168]|uniref:5'-nucleotidase C-terminal domain-containing protein n=1 Tax=Niallia sp. MER TA 168 TaxID=2939568 RepID=UPI00203EC7C6|nr:5'-nucleotidase C-terminal domain-containing protein [Niallia sp. MER TA 168]MCM3364923.1 5'-nucleotidase C-terminal domain-containing protein [Niallia sp. MER TA 168]
MKGKKHFTFLLSAITTLVLLVSIVLPASTYAEENSDSFKLTIMHMNDTHAHADLLPNMMTAIKEVRTEDPEALLFNAGDVFSGTLYFNEYHGKADLALLNMMDLDAMVFGNHEFDLGSSENGHKSLSEFVSAAKFPLLGTNVDFSSDAFMNKLVKNEFTDSPEDGKVFDGMVKEVNGEKIGIFGLTTEDTANISSPVNVKFLNYIKEAERAVQAFEEMGINKIVAVTHLGYDSNPDFGNDLQLATYVDGIDIVVGGHSHTQLSEPVVINKDEKGTEKEPTVVVQAYQYSQLLGKLQVEFDGNGVVNGQAGQLIDVASKEEDSEAAAILAPYKEKITELSTQESGAIAKKTLANPRLTDSDVSVRANETELGNLVTDAMLAKAKERYPETVIAFQNGGGIRAAIEEGPITIGEIISVLPFGNDPVVVELSGEEIKQILEHSVSQAPAESGGFLHVAGMKFTYDSTKESGSRVISMYVKVNGEYQEIQANQKYLVTTNNFTAKGGDGFDVFAKAYQEGRVQDIGEIDWEQLRKYMVEDLGGVVDPVLEGRITDLLGTDPETPGDEEEEVTPEEPEVENPETGGNEDDSSDTDNPTDATGSETDDDNTDIGDNAGIENDTELEQDVNDNQGSKETVSNSSEGNALPNTATSMYTMLLVGGILLVAGIGFLVFRMMKYSKA